MLTFIATSQHVKQVPWHQEPFQPETVMTPAGDQRSGEFVHG